MTALCDEYIAHVFRTLFVIGVLGIERGTHWVTILTSIRWDRALERRGSTKLYDADRRGLSGREAVK